MAGRPIKKRTCAPPVAFRAMPENEIPLFHGGIFIVVKRKPRDYHVVFAKNSPLERVGRIYYIVDIVLKKTISLSFG